jgi:hypothetical protein
MDYQVSVKRCENILCQFCGKKLKPIKNDSEKRFNHLSCEDKWFQLKLQEAFIKWQQEVPS